MKLTQSLILAGGLIAASGAQSAIIGDISFTLDWNTLNITTSDPVVMNPTSFTFDGATFSSTQDAFVGYGTTEIGDSSLDDNPVSVSYSAGDGSLNLSSGYDPDPAVNAIYGQGDINNSTEADQGGFAGAFRNVFYQASGAGTVTFSIDYTLSGSMSISEINEFGNAWASYQLEAYDVDTFLTTYNNVLNPEGTNVEEAIEAADAASQKGLSEDTTEVLKLYFGCEAIDDCLPSADDAGTLSLSFDVEDGRNYYFGADGEIWIGSQVSIVPVPAAVWLFGSGLIGLIGTARRKT